MPIRLGEGTGLIPKGIEEIRLGDGTVLGNYIQAGSLGYSWDQTHTDTQWIFDADAADNITIETVTNLDDTGSGSLDAALSAAGSNANTLIVFEVGGVINNLGETFIRSNSGSNVYIAGQTAPSPGITVIRGGLRIHENNHIVQHMTWLPGDNIDDPNQARAITIDTDSQHNLIDHCTGAWAPDTNFSFRGAKNATAINCINAEPLNESSHPEAPHGYGLHIRANTEMMTYMGNLQTHCWKRNIKPNENCQLLFASNYIYNWGTRVWHGSDPDSQCDWISGVIEAGTDTDTSAGVFKDTPGVIYWSDNELIPTNTPLADGEIVYVNDAQFLPTGLDEEDIVTSDSIESFLVDVAGPRPADRPAVEQRLVNDFVNRQGQIIDNESDVGGYPNYSSTSRSLNPPSTNVLDWLQNYTDEVELGMPIGSA